MHLDVFREVVKQLPKCPVKHDSTAYQLVFHGKMAQIKLCSVKIVELLE